MHFVGIGGVGMSGLARLLLARGMPVSGSEPRDSATLGALRALGATIHIGHDASNLDGVDTWSTRPRSADDNLELVEAPRRGLRVLHRAAALAAAMAGRRGDRGRRHPRQDHDHLDARPSPAALRRGPVVRDRRRARRVRRQRRTTAPASSSSPRPTRATARSCCSRRRSRSSPTSRPTTSTTTARPRPVARVFEQFARRIDPDGFLVVCADDPGARRWPPAAARRRRPADLRRRPATPATCG